ncbi:Asp-tRNA(Asn)/Glu-tRNA(Gln) amidotransferase subunit GatA [Syntrophomonas wolfei]|uniref:Glutamyl-tRNA(Gln) amidotransferase subunit A n=1 Tax=Syntrophomonas wolfei subsp. wolfei (strain DSM 2245B / Goettingen) TaxID=335541 RepID=GATA_SYNWW|nr:Asp-tRNA(Asn)/Glu-tRNA(Gln) amidotransferase subunit GatA [Syntrophomonas wolfei]Q0AZZ2.1 RecName: Full=Glutamyl-tRNA(Gln) amidotransferase subunit A; Short=Glu-ADT subunit A [Syntrophomonas wolfei subsp. wolfei str. Goettingen G311]ABI67712.1 aspartyl/glutamyl-tRNA(Asn/Gln) amidotransferase subunit A [Syntrophomonas wolfei subsp. wolfei str. Goettingen G311]
MDLYKLTVHELQDKLLAGEISSEDIVKSLFSRIALVEEKAQAFITLCEETALEGARRIDQQDEYGGIKGIPYGLKDLFCTRGIKTTCASRMLENFVPSYESTASKLLNEKGGILLGKLNLDEFAMGSSTEQSAFFPSRNPWDWERVPGGSSGGCAAAVAAGEIPFALASDTGGSIRQPASYCGIVGLKPTYGRVSRWGVAAFASSLDQVGILSRDVRDCALILKIIAGKDPLDATSADTEVPNYCAFLDGEVKGMRIAYPREYFQHWVTESIRTAVMKALRKFEELGAIVEEVSLPHSEYALPAYYIVAPAEASTNLARFDGVRYGLRDDEADNVIDMFSLSRAQGFGPEVKRRIMLGTYALSSGYYDAYYLKAMKVRRLIASDFAKVFRDFDLIVSPTTPTTAFKLGEQIDDTLTLYMNDALTVPVNMAGLPGISIPCALDDGLPVGMQLIGRAFDEATLLKAAYAFEQNTDYHRLTPVPGGGINE